MHLEFSKALVKFQKRPSVFYKEILGVETLEKYQEECLQAIADNERTAIAACHDLGKTFLVARVVPWFLSCFKYSKIITTAPTYNQVKNILWSEIRTAKSKALYPIGGDINLTSWNIDDGWFALGFTPRNEISGEDGQGTQSSFQGFHAEGGVLVIFDEATGIPPNIWVMTEGLLTSNNVKFVAIGNPTSKNSEFYNCFRSSAWKKVYLSCFDSPNLIANGITDINKLRAEIEKVKAMPDATARAYLDKYQVPRPYLLTAKWVVNNSTKWGLEHPLTVSKILGKFPVASDKTLLPLNYVEDAQLRVYYPVKTDRKIIGVDVARFGTDSSVFTALHGAKQLKRHEIYKQDTLQVSGEAIAMSRDIGGADIIVVDETGLGAGVVDQLQDEVGKSLPKDCEIRGVQFGGGVDCSGSENCDHKDCDKAKYYNLKARMFGLLRDDMKSASGLALLNEAVYAEELPTIRFEYNKKGQMVIESKDEYKKRTGRRSPDSSDSLALANYGRYDELKIGKFSDHDKNKDKPKTHAGGFKNRRDW